MTTRPGARGIATAMHDSYQKLFEGRLKSSDDFITLKKYLLFYTSTHELPIKSSIDNKTHVGGVIKIVNNSRLIEQNILFEPWGKLPRKITNIKFHRHDTYSDLALVVK